MNCAPQFTVNSRVTPHPTKPATGYESRPGKDLFREALKRWPRRQKNTICRHGTLSSRGRKSHSVLGSMPNRRSTPGIAAWLVGPVCVSPRKPRVRPTGFDRPASDSNIGLKRLEHELITNWLRNRSSLLSERARAPYPRGLSRNKITAQEPGFYSRPLFGLTIYGESHKFFPIAPLPHKPI
jgi:hypothetical protein